MSRMNGQQRDNLYKRFDHGQIIAIHSISDFDIIEFRLNTSNTDATSGDILFSPYYNGEPLGQWCKILDESLCYALAGKYLNPQAGKYLVNLLDIKSESLMRQ